MSEDPETVAWANKACKEIQRLKTANAILLEACKHAIKMLIEDGAPGEHFEQQAADMLDKAILDAEGKP
jgi:hypothetical protein